MNKIKNFIVIWTPVSEKVGTVEVERSLIYSTIDNRCHVFHIGACMYFSSTFPEVSTALLGQNIIRITLFFNRVLGGRITTLLQSVPSFIILLFYFIRHRPSKVSFITCLFPIPVLLLHRFILAFFSRCDSRCFCFIQGAPAFNAREPKYFFRNWRSIEALIRRAFFKHIYTFATAIIVSSPTLKNSLISQFGYSSKSLLVIPNGILDFSIYRNDVYNLQEFKQFNLLFIGRLTHQKNIENFLETFLRHKSSLNFPAKLHVVGDGDLSDILINKYSFVDDISFYGFLNDPWALVIDNPIVVTPSFWEEPGHVPLEAISKGLVALTSNQCTCVDFFDPLVKDLYTFHPRNLDYIFNVLLSPRHLANLIANQKKLFLSIQSFSYESFRSRVRQLIHT